MNSNSVRPCPICGAAADGRGFPYETCFNGSTFYYVRCCSCKAVFVDPVPDSDTFSKMYAKASYHDAHYLDRDTTPYDQSARLLSRFLPLGASVLDYGCGLGLFLKAIRTEGFLATGVEFDQEAADFAAKNSGSPAFAVATFLSDANGATYDALHFGDVLEHLPDPAATVRELLRFVKPGGLVFVEGPLENNASPVFWAAQMFGAIKRLAKPNFKGSSPPTHLLRVNAAQQLAFFTRVDAGLSLLHWDVYETGWPYAGGALVKRAIAGAASAIGGKRISDVTFGNRFHGLFRLPDEARS